MSRTLLVHAVLQLVLVKSRASTGRASLYLIFVRSMDRTNRDLLTLCKV